MLLKQNFEAVPEFKTIVNIGALMDIPTGFPVKGKYGETIWQGGLGMITAIAGRGNTFKSTIMHYMMLSALSRVCTSVESSAGTYDTEVNIHLSRLLHFSKQFENFSERDVIDEGIWTITDNTRYQGDEWFEKFKEFVKFKIKNLDKIKAESPFLSKDGTLFEDIIPTFGEIDSFSEFVSSDVTDILDKNAIGESGGNTVYMRQGLGKTRLLMELPHLSGRSNHFVLLSAHVGQEMNIQAGPMSIPPPKKLQHMKSGEKIKGVTDKFFYLLHNCWMVTACKVLMNDSDKTPKYPKDDRVAGDKDLNVVTLTNLRCKSGQSGFTLDIIVSQTEGVLPSLTEFNHLKDYGDFGFLGNKVNYQLALYPEVNLSRTTIRTKINEDVKLRRALNITSELAQLHRYHRHLEDYIISPEELREGLVKQGYDVDFLLENTRGWWTYNNDKVDKFFMSTMDFVLAAKGRYHPYWLEDDKKTIKKEFQRKV